LFDQPDQGEQITVKTGGRIQLKTKWKPSEFSPIGRLIPGTPAELDG
jgi:hypothetical protein